VGKRNDAEYHEDVSHGEQLEAGRRHEAVNLTGGGVNKTTTAFLLEGRHLV
jgi:hypothetical protein